MTCLIDRPRVDPKVKEKEMPARRRNGAESHPLSEADRAVPVSCLSPRTPAWDALPVVILLHGGGKRRATSTDEDAGRQ
jgi:hypothetical protein